MGVFQRRIAAMQMRLENNEGLLITTGTLPNIACRTNPVFTIKIALLHSINHDQNPILWSALTI